MAAGPRQQRHGGHSAFGKRGDVRLTAPPSAKAPSMTTSVTASGPSTQAQSDREANWRNVMSGLSNPIKWAGGGLAVLALAAMLSVGS